MSHRKAATPFRSPHNISDIISALSGELACTLRDGAVSWGALRQSLTVATSFRLRVNTEQFATAVWTALVCEIEAVRMPALGEVPGAALRLPKS